MKNHGKYKSAVQIIRLFVKDKQLFFSFCRNSGRVLGKRILSSTGLQKFVFISLTEHIGDIVAAEPVIQALRKQFPSQRLVWVVNEKYASLVRSHPQINDVLTVTSFTEWILLQKFFPANSLLDLHLHGKICDKYGFYYSKKVLPEINNQNYYHYGNLLNAFSKSASLRLDQANAPALYLRGEPIHCAKPYLVLHTSSNNKFRNATADFWKQLAEVVFKNFPGVDVVEIGLEKKINSDSEHYVDQTGFKSLDRIVELIRGCTMFLGVDSGFAHFANAIEKESLIFIGEYNGFKNYMPYSGKFQKESNHQIFYFDNCISELRFETIQQKLIKRINAVIKKDSVQSLPG